MKRTFLFVCVALAISSSAYGQGIPIESPITLEEINRRNVVGRLGVPLGTAVEIEAEVVSGSSLHLKGYDSHYLLKVTHVNGKEVGTPSLFGFSVPAFAAVKLANHTFALYEMKYGTKAMSLDSSQVAELEQGYVGRSVQLLAYEVGGFSGIPRELPKDAPVWADTGFHFSTSLTVLKERDAASKSGRTKR